VVDHALAAAWTVAAGYFSVEIAGQDPLEDVAWFYEKPYPSVAEIAGHVAFYADRAEVLTLED
jgi:uncharacterized protein (DUF427 family)